PTKLQNHPVEWVTLRGPGGVKTGRVRRVWRPGLVNPDGSLRACAIVEVEGATMPTPNRDSSQVLPPPVPLWTGLLSALLAGGGLGAAAYFDLLRHDGVPRWLREAGAVAGHYQVAVCLALTLGALAMLAFEALRQRRWRRVADELD